MTKFAQGGFSVVNKLPHASLPSTIYVDSATGDDTGAGTAGDPLATLAEAASRIPNGYTDRLDVQLVGAGPYTDPAWPAPGPFGNITVIGDRTPVASDASPTFAAVTGKRAQSEDTGFTSPATTEGTHWALSDWSGLGIPVLTWQSYPCLTRASGTIGVCANFGPSGVPVEINAFTTTVNIGYDATARGVEYHGCIVQPSYAANFLVSGYDFWACKFVHAGGQFTISDGFFGGIIEAPSAGSVNFRDKGKLSTCIIRAGSATLNVDNRVGDGQLTIQQSIIEEDINLLRDTHTQIRNCDLEGGGGIKYSSGVFAELTDLTFSSVSTIASPSSSVDGRAVFRCFGSNWAGSVSGNGFELVNGSAILDDSVCSGVTVTGSDIDIDAATATKTFGGARVFDTTTGCLAVP